MNDVPLICKREAQPRDNIEYNHENKKKYTGISTRSNTTHGKSPYFFTPFTPFEYFNYTRSKKKYEEQRHHLRKLGAWFSTIEIIHLPPRS